MILGGLGGVAPQKHFELFRGEGGGGKIFQNTTVYYGGGGWGGQQDFWVLRSI